LAVPSSQEPPVITRAVDEARAALERTAAAAAGNRVVDVVLYVTESAASLRALRNLERFVRAHADLRVRLRVWDLSREPLGADAAEDRVAFTPMLVKREPPPRERLLGDLQRVDRLEELLIHDTPQ
jgi:hypothetical protein